MKATKALVLTICLLLVTLSSVFTFSASAATYGDYQYTIDNNKVTITKCNKTVSGEITIPSKINNKTVTRIDSEAFKDCKNITNIIIPNSIEYIGYEAFRGCTNITSITIPDNVIHIGYHAFADCSNLTTVFIGKGVDTICDNAFSCCEKLTNFTVNDNNEYYSSMDGVLFDKKQKTLVQYPIGKNSTTYTIPESVINIGNSAFFRCIKLTNITIPSNIIRIDNSAFAECSNLVSVIIDDGVKDIGEGVFNWCSKLANINIPDSVTSIGSSFYQTAFYNNENNWENSVLYIGNHLIEAEKSISDYYAVKDGTKTIANDAFSSCVNLTNITISQSVTSIGRNAFKDCSNLKNITIGNNVNSIGESAFFNTAYYNNPNNWENKVLYIGNHLIKAESSISGFYEIKAGTKTIADKAFYSCDSITNITLADSIKNIGNSAFYSCDNLADFIFPKCVTSIGNEAFMFCHSLTTITIPNSIALINTGTFYGCDSLTTVTIPNSIIRISDSAFAGCYSLLNITLPNSVMYIDDYAFLGCHSLTTITMGNRIKSIGTSAFYNCYQLKNFWYSGSKEDATDISIGLNNDYLLKSTWHYNTCLDNHEYSSNCDETCGKCDWTREGTEHTYVYDCSSECNFCDATRIATHNYEWIIDKTENCGIDGVKHEECTICHEKINENTIIFATGKHTYDNACDIECNICKQNRTINHDFKWIIDDLGNCGIDGAKHEECTVCHTKRNENTIIPATGNHKYTNSCDTTCDVCNESRTITHSYKTTTTKATTSKDGKIVKKCTVCDNVASSTTIKYAKTFTLSVTSYTYDGKVKTPTVVVKDSSGKTLKKDTDYTVTYPSGRKNAGTYKVVITLKGNYTGSKTLSFKIIPISVSKCEIALSKTSYTYDGKSKIPSAMVLNHNGTKLTDSSYTVTYASGRKNVGTYKVAIKMKGNYTGTKTLTFKINPAKTTVSKLTAGKKSITVAITKKSTQVTGYQIQYSTSKTFSNATTKTISSYKTTKYTLKSLSAKKTYYVRVRTYKTVGKTKYYSGWSTYKYVKTK